MPEEYLALLMIGTLFVALMAGYPVAFTLGGVALIFGWIGFGLPFFDLLPLRIWGIMTNFTLLAVPLFVFMGVTLERSGLAEDLLETMGLLFGGVRGGLAVSVILVGALLAASTGIVGATVVTMGMLALPTMLKRHYQPEFATGVITSSGTLGQIIPPSIILVILGDIINVPVGELFLGAVGPGLLLIFMYVTWVIFVALIKPELAPAIPAVERAEYTFSKLLIKTAHALVPPLFLMVAVLGSIFAGIASPTEAAAMGGFGGLFLTALNGRLTIPMLKETARSTTKITTMIFIILIGATTFGLVFRGLGGDDLIRAYLHNEALGPMAAIILVMIVLFILGFFLDFIEITFIVIPLVAPAMIEHGFNPLWFAILVAMNLQTSFLTPPFGFSLFYLKGVAPKEITTGQIYRGAIPFVIIQVIALALLTIFPDIVLWLPEQVTKSMFQ